MDDAHSSTAPAHALEAQPVQQPPRLPLPVPLLMQLLRPIANEDDVASLAAQLDSARARGCLD